MKSTRSLAALLAAGTLLTLPALAQSGAPVAEPPPAAPTPEQSVSVEKPAQAPISLTEAGTTQAAGKGVTSGAIKELRFSGVDADSDGLISLSEFSVFMDAGNAPRAEGSAGVSPTEQLFRHIDRNGDNFLSEAEVIASQKEQDGAKQ
jgi:hypothetical protein